MAKVPTLFDGVQDNDRNERDESTPSQHVPIQRRSVEHYRACLMGGAIGDAMGAASVHMTLTQIREKYGEQGINDFVEKKDGIGRITNKTQLTLFTAEGMLRSIHRGFLKGIWGAYTMICWQSYMRWLRTQGIELQTKNSDFMEEALRIGWLMDVRGLYQKRGGSNTLINALKGGVAGTMERPINNSKGSGGVVRVAPIGLLFYKEPEIAFQYGAELAAYTHGHPSGYLPAGFLAALLAFINRGHTINQALDLTTPILTKYPKHEETLSAVNRARFHQATTDPTPENLEKLGSGRTGEEALAMAIYCAFSFRDTNFKQGLWLSVNHSGDTDTVGAITGNILGLLHGERAIPLKWWSNVDMGQVVTQVAEDLHTEVPASRGDYWWEKYPGY